MECVGICQEDYPGITYSSRFLYAPDDIRLRNSLTRSKGRRILRAYCTMLFGLKSLNNLFAKGWQLFAGMAFQSALPYNDHSPAIRK